MNYRFKDIRGKGHFHVSSLYGGLEEGSIRHLRTILEGTDADPNETLPRLGVSPLHLAIGNDSEYFAEEVTRLFLQYGGDPNVRSTEGETPVHIAAAWGRVNILKLLLINGGDPWLYDGDNKNAFHLAYDHRQWKVLQLLNDFRLEDLQRENDLNHQKYIITLDKVHLYNKNIVIEYDDSPQCEPLISCGRSIGTQTSLDDGRTTKQTADMKKTPPRENNLQVKLTHSSSENVTPSAGNNAEILEEEIYYSKRNLSDEIMEKKGDGFEKSRPQDVCTVKVPQDSSRTSASSSAESFVSVMEEYKYSDVEEGVVLLEKRFLVPAIRYSFIKFEEKNYILRPGLEPGTTLRLSNYLDYDTDVLRKRLLERGFTPGPIIPSTKKLYLRKLVRLEKNPVRISPKTKVYSPELQRTLSGFNWTRWLSQYLKLEKEVTEQFSEPEPRRRWREGNIKSSFTYLLLDPRISQNLPCRAETLNHLEIWSVFLSAIFYVGKGKRSRPYSHLYQAFNVFKSNTFCSPEKKVQYILDVWKSGMGVVCLHIYQNVIPVEAYTREAAMIDALGLRNIQNVRCGEYYGIASTWTSHEKRLLGTFLLYRAMLIFLQEGERQLRPVDIC
ncbi:hypothetical protein L9F63_001619 [Diploptera punctata]|uniref:LEM domain-containing protein n=1 Tax=Diploptera punctata TaxID=6984 RepID=A0AAD8A3K6_DIPPU|nr:hypothetical protein L9F63_001619 [Diploptera punctata]